MMVKNVSPVIRSDGYHIVSDLTGVPDLYAHIGPVLKRKESGLSRRARLLVLAWIFVTVPVLLALALGAVLLLPRLLTSAWESGSVLVGSLGDRGAIGTAAALLQLFALALPAAGSLLIAQKLTKLAIVKGRDWSAGRPVRRGIVVLAYSAIAAGLAFAWWPQGQYQPVPAQGGTLISFTHAVTDPVSSVRPAPTASLQPGTYLALSMVPRDDSQPALYVIPSKHIALVGSGAAAKVIPFDLPAPPGPGDTQALAVNTTDGSVVYDLAYGLITVSDGAPVTSKNSAFALASCNACSTVAVSFQVVLVVGHSNIAAPINAAGALNYQCPSCVTAALATQIVVTLKEQPTAELVSKLQAALQELDAVRQLGSLQEIQAAVADVKKQIDTALQESGQVENQTTTAQRTTTTTPAATTTTATTTQSTTTATTTAQTTTQSTTTTAQTTTETTPTTTEAVTTTTQSGG
jgi:putative peptide zinc metalloprotease protein